MTEHLVREFPEVPTQDVARQVLTAWRAATAFGLGDGDAIETVELICLYQLSVQAGRVDDAARLDPQSHLRARAVYEADGGTDGALVSV